jgi:hypothetical protein
MADLPHVVTDIGPVKAQVRPVAEEIANRWVSTSSGTRPAAAGQASIPAVWRSTS